jgi:tetratricopeptide (TPR) repeat protein
LLIVRDGEHTSQDDPARGLGFQVLGEAERAAIKERRDAILALDGLDEPARHLALAVYYAGLDLEGGRGLWGDAWLLLESVAQTRDAPAVQLLLGDMSAAMKMPDEAETAYRAALQGAEALGDLESQAAAYAGLWRLIGSETDWEEAITLYETLGDEAQVEALHEEKNQ